MDSTAPETTQTVQRVKVGMTGLALVLLLIGLASAIFSSASKEPPVDVAGAAKPEVVANISVTNGSAAAAPATTSEPLAELGVAPSTTDTNDSSDTVVANRSAPPAPSVAPPPRR